jgi:hypothetical protein
MTINNVKNTLQTLNIEIQTVDIVILHIIQHYLYNNINLNLYAL